MTVNRTENGNRIAAETEAAIASRNGHRPPARGLIETVAAGLRELYANRLIAALDGEGLGGELSDGDLHAILHLVRSLDGRGPLPQRQPGATGSQPAQRL